MVILVRNRNHHTEVAEHLEADLEGAVRHELSLHRSGVTRRPHGVLCTVEQRGDYGPRMYI